MKCPLFHRIAIRRFHCTDGIGGKVHVTKTVTSLGLENFITKFYIDSQLGFITKFYVDSQLGLITKFYIDSQLGLITKFYIDNQLGFLDDFNFIRYMVGEKFSPRQYIPLL
jgi:hypothetical protein